MTFNLEQFRAFCADDTATMLARACADDSRNEVFACTHELACQPVGVDDLVLRKLDRESRRALGVLYEAHSSAALFIVDFEPALVLAAPGEWEALASQVEDWWRDAADEMDADERTTLESGIVFGRIPSAATYFLTPRAGKRKGKVLMFCHDGLELVTLAESFPEFLSAIPRSAVGWVASDVRYTPAAPGDQFYPVAYRPAGIERASARVARIWIESKGHADSVKLELRETTPSGIEVRSPAGHTYDLVVELYPNDEASISVEGGEALHLFVRGHGAMRALGTLGHGDVANIEVMTEGG